MKISFFLNSWKFESGASENYISTKTLATDPQKHLQKIYFLIRKVIFSTKKFLSSRKKIQIFTRRQFFLLQKIFYLKNE